MELIIYYILNIFILLYCVFATRDTIEEEVRKDGTILFLFMIWAIWGYFILDRVNSGIIH